MPGDTTRQPRHRSSIPPHMEAFISACSAIYAAEMEIPMKNSKELLTSLLKTTQMGQVGIRSVLDTSMQPGLRKALESQLREYDAIESEAHAIASGRGWELPELAGSARVMAGFSSRMKLTGNNSDSKIADMMIQGNTRGMIKGLKAIHQFGRQDEPVCILSQKLLDTENANIRQMQSFL